MHKKSLFYYINIRFELLYNLFMLCLGMLNSHTFCIHSSIEYEKRKDM